MTLETSHNPTTNVSTTATKDTPMWKCYKLRVALKAPSVTDETTTTPTKRKKKMIEVSEIGCQYH